LKRRTSVEDVPIVNQIESAQVSIKEMITNVEHSNQDLAEGKASAAGTVTVEHSVDEVFGRIKSWYESRLQEKEIRVDLSRADSEHRIRAGADAFIYQIFMNLFSNAIKFTPQGGTIAIQTHCSADGVVTWTIADEGEGIYPDAFSESPVSRAGTLGESGSGLGIKIARAFAQDYGIELKWVSRHISVPASSPPLTARGTVVRLTQVKRPE
jgi:signal transduction histidine kinase